MVGNEKMVRWMRGYGMVCTNVIVSCQQLFIFSNVWHEPCQAEKSSSVPLAAQDHQRNIIAKNVVFVRILQISGVNFLSLA